MAKAKFAVASRKRRKRALERAKGFRGAASKNIRTVYDAIDKADAHAYVGRKQKKRQYRRLWTVRINAACRMNGMNYSSFINGLKKAGCDLNRKVLADIAVRDEEAFLALIETAKKGLEAPAAKKEEAPAEKPKKAAPKKAAKKEEKAEEKAAEAEEK